ncbi:hypothetical protein [Helicobacter sp. UBA3407]|nr:hypothetical protein [Helicobacter sp. UBA3407]
MVILSLQICNARFRIYGFTHCHNSSQNLTTTENYLFCEAQF